MIFRTFSFSRFSRAFLFDLINKPSIHYIIKLHVLNIPCYNNVVVLNNNKLFITHISIVPLFNYLFTVFRKICHGRCCIVMDVMYDEFQVNQLNFV